MTIQRKKKYSPSEVERAIVEAGDLSDVKLSRLLNVSTRTIFRLRHSGADERQMNRLKEGLQKIKDGRVDPNTLLPPALDLLRELSKEDLQFLLKISESLSRPITVGLALELLSKK